MEQGGDPNLCCPPKDKEELEARNGALQFQYIAELVVKRGARKLRESHVRELQGLAIEGIYSCGGTYRDVVRDVYIQGSSHQVPSAALVPNLVREAIEWINDDAGVRQLSALEKAAYALWRFNWIHPFRGGNGRTSRAIAYLIVCMDHGSMLPGSITMPTFIARARDEYIDALRAVDRSCGEDFSGVDLQPMVEFLQKMLVQQLATFIDSLSTKPTTK